MERTLPLYRNYSEKLRNVNTGSEPQLRNALRNSGRIAPVLPVPFAFQPVREMKGRDVKITVVFGQARVVQAHESIWVKSQNERRSRSEDKWKRPGEKTDISGFPRSENQRVQSSLLFNECVQSSLLIRGWTNGWQVARGYQPTECNTANQVTW